MVFSWLLWCQKLLIVHPHSLDTLSKSPSLSFPVLSNFSVSGFPRVRSEVSLCFLTVQSFFSEYHLLCGAEPPVIWQQFRNLYLVPNFSFMSPGPIYAMAYLKQSLGSFINFQIFPAWNSSFLPQILLLSVFILLMNDIFIDLIARMKILGVMLSPYSPWWQNWIHY